ncbi:MAG TPA: NifU family protein [Actinomycetota bacterium]|nr:NifU family protein [Actinomycetota bacterium]
MATLEEALARLEGLVAEMEELDEPVRDRVFELLDGVDAIHRMAVERLAEAAGPEVLDRFRDADPAVAWLFHAYGVGADDRVAAEAALEEIRPYIDSHGGTVEVLEAHGGRLKVRLSGACAGCTASAVTLQEGIEQAFRDHYPGFVAMEVEEDEAPAHPPPGPTLIELRPLPREPAP